MRVSSKRTSARRGGIFLAVFSLPLLAGGLVITGLALQGACNSVRSRNWPTVPAIVSAVDLETDEESSRVTCRYSYAFGGRPFEATRIGVMTGADSIGSWQQKTYERLRRAYESEQTVPAWVNPAAPHESFLDRRLRINLFLCVLAVGLLFTGVGGGLLAAALLSLTNRGRRQAAYTDPPKELWRRRSDWSSGRLVPNIRAKAAGVWLFAVFWNLLTWLMLLASKGELLREGWPGLLALVFPVVGAGLLIHATRLTLIQRKFGRCHVVLETIPGVVGGHLRGRLMLIGRTDALSDVHLELRCVRQYTTGSGEDSTEHRDILWADERSVIPALRFGQTEIALPFEFQIPHSLHETEALGKEDGVRWELHARGRCPGTDMLLIFEVPVFRTPASDEQIGEPAERRAREEAVLDSPETPLPRQIRVERTPEGYTRYRISAFPGLGFMLVFIAADLLFSGVAVFAFTRVVRGEWFMLIFLLAFGALGLLMAIPVISGWGAYLLTLLPGAIDVRRSIGPLAWSRRLDAGRIVVVDTKVCASTSGGRKWFEVFCRLDAEDTRAKRRYTLAVNIAGDLGARWLKRRIEEHVARPAVSTRVQAETR